MAADKHTERVNLPPIPAKRYFTIGEVSDLCAVKPHVLRYWEQEFTQLKPVKRRGNRRYYQHHEVLLIRRIRELLYEQGFTINGARNRLDELRHGVAAASPVEAEELEMEVAAPMSVAASASVDVQDLRRELSAVLEVLRTDKP
ncbi:MerR family transcriptional regulator [Ralstonia sp. NFACC01]|jgi:DNA-binding transcriptional MerR regulator|uniref:MerR family transcriptional regulator n=1 Tax=Ralstonia sp. NFACC01 TaxID=1566294 RepID=UPI0008E116D9|nr:MerR family transcriptional regulator [Ralstonia sp. NFACC01]SFO89190.1 transcriptional regulator, MerR family [Ralstonia sp. NFACC01]